MKIGILTYHRSHNYGALLQAIALRKVLEDIGNKVSFVDYWPAYHQHMYALFSFSWMMSRKGINGKVSYLSSSISNFIYRKKRKNNFDRFIAEYIEPFLSSADETYDVLVHGSDQIWRKQPEIQTYNPIYFGMHQIWAKKKISYAASMGILPERDSDKQVIKRLLPNLDLISVRERDLLDLVNSLGYTDVHQDLDPTLLLTSEDWVNMFNLKKWESEEKYALYYKIKDSFDVCRLQQFASTKGLKLKVLHSKAICQDNGYEITTASPIQFLDLIYNADFVFTSSFHGLAFALLFHKPFFASFTNNAGRAASLLESLNLLDYLVRPKTEINLEIEEINYHNVDKKLYEMRESSKKWLYRI